MILHHNPDPTDGVDINTDTTELTTRVMLRVMLVVNVKSWFMAKCLNLSTLLLRSCRLTDTFVQNECTEYNDRTREVNE